MNLKRSTVEKPGLKQHESLLYERRQERDTENNRLDQLKQRLQEKLSEN